MTVVPADTAPRRFPALRLPLLTLQLLWRFWPQLMVLWLVGMIADGVLNELAVMIGRWNSLAGLSTLALVVLTKLVIVVALFETVRSGLPALDAASRPAAAEPTEGDAEAKSLHFTSALALTLVPFFAYYAAWGFLADTIRNYSKLSLDLMMSGQAMASLEIKGGAWLFVSVAIAWLVRRFAKAMRERSGSPVWPVVIVICEANWAFIGLFVISNWEGDIRAWAARLPEVIGSFFGWLAPVGDAAAATVFPPAAEDVAISAYQQVRNLFLYALYPLVWLTLAALVYGYDINGDRPIGEGRIGRALSRWAALPKPVRDFIAHFYAGTAKRYRALAEGVGMAINTGFAVAVMAVVLYRALDWGSAWAWYGLARMIGPHDLQLWQIIAHGISLLFGTPSAPGDGILVMPVKVCLLAAALEIGFTQGRAWHGNR